MVQARPNCAGKRRHGIHHLLDVAADHVERRRDAGRRHRAFPAAGFGRRRRCRLDRLARRATSSRRDRTAVRAAGRSCRAAALPLAPARWPRPPKRCTGTSAATITAAKRSPRRTHDATNSQTISRLPSQHDPRRRRSAVLAQAAPRMYDARWTVSAGGFIRRRGGPAAAPAAARPPARSGSARSAAPSRRRCRPGPTPPR